MVGLADVDWRADGSTSGPSVGFGLKSGDRTIELGLTLSTSMGGRSRSTNLASDPSNSSNVLNASALTSFTR